MQPPSTRILAQIVVSSLFAVSVSTAATLPSNFVYASTTATLSYSTPVGPIPIDGLSVTLPAASDLYNTAIVTLSMPNLYLSAPANDSVQMSAQIEVVAPFSAAGVVYAFGYIGCDTPRVKMSGSKPMTIVLKVPLGASSQFAEAEWATYDGNTVTTNTFASISAILVRE